MKRVVDIVIQVIIITMLVLTIILPKKEFSENENRYLKVFPIFTIDKVLDGRFMTLMTEYVADHFPFRKELMNFKTSLFKFVGVKRQNNVYYSDDGYLIEEYEKPLNNEKIVRALNRFIDSNSNIKYDFMLVPTSSYVLKDKLPKYNLNYDESNTLKFFMNNINANYIDVTEILLQNRNEYIYYRTDHHWTTRGAYLAYREFCKNNDMIHFDYNFNQVSDEFYGTLYSKVIDNSLEHDIIEKVVDSNLYTVEYQNNTFDSMYNDKYLNQKDKYSYFLGGNNPLVTITNSNVSDREILIIKDSYANSFIPLIARHYSKIHVIDPRYYKKKISDYIKENSIKHILFLYNVGTIDEDLGILSIN